MQPLILPPQSQPVLDGKLLHRTWYLFLQVLEEYAATGAGIVRHGTRAQRLSTPLRELIDNTVWIETDTAVWYQYRAEALAWGYVQGVFSCTLAELALAQPTLRWNDTGLLIHVTDYARLFEWTGGAFVRAPGERPTREFGYFAEDPGVGWHLCDGTAAVKYTKADASTGTMTMPDETGLYRVGGAAYTGAKVDGNLTGLVGSVTNETAGTPTGTVNLSGGSVGVGYAAIGGPSANGAAAAGAGASVPTSNHTHADGGHTHGFSGSGATFVGDEMAVHHHNAGTLTLAEAPVPDHLVLLPYMKL